MPMNLKQIARVLNQTCDAADTITGVSLDSRNVKPMHLFVALRGERVDGHDFIVDAIQRGAIAVVSARFVPECTVTQFVVPCPVTALAQLATAHRLTLSCPVMALTGSNGKTTVKEMMAAMLPAPSFATPGNLNNHLGVPWSVLQLNEHHRYAVFELGANHVGEIAHTVAMVKPDVTLINNIAPAHLEGFGGLEGVVRAKGEIHQGLSPTGTAVVNEDDAYAHAWDSVLSSRRVVGFSMQHAASVHARALTFNAEGQGRFVLVTPLGEALITLQVPGRHNVGNALAAAASAYALGLSLQEIASGLERFQGVSGRMTFRRGQNEAVIIDDTYNANLRSALTALDVLAERLGTRVFVLGDMGELGSSTEEHHRALGLAAREKGIDAMLTCGQHSRFAAEAFGFKAKHYESQDELVYDLRHQLDAHTTVLVKGSRAAAMENIVQQLLESSSCFTG